MAGGYRESKTYGGEERLEWGWAWQPVELPNQTVVGAWASEAERLRRQRGADVGVRAQLRGRDLSRDGGTCHELK